jgi:hypothetical protein
MVGESGGGGSEATGRLSEIGGKLPPGAENLYTSAPAAVTALNDRLVKFNGAANNHGSETFLRTRCTTLLALDMRSG